MYVCSELASSLLSCVSTISTMLRKANQWRVFFSGGFDIFFIKHDTFFKNITILIAFS